jgi:hypothetical protein
MLDLWHVLTEWMNRMGSLPPDNCVVVALEVGEWNSHR